MKRRALWVGLAVVALGCTVGCHKEADGAKGDSAGKKGGKGGAGGPVPVSVADATTANVPIYIQGIGNVQAYQTVTVRARIDGELQKVAYKEGQDVKEGDLLAVIDPRPYQAALEQAAAKKSQDEAQLTSAQKDLERYKVLVQQKLQQAQTLDQQDALVHQLEAAVRGDQANVDSARVNLGYTHITAPFSGRVGIRLIDVGNIVHAADTTGIVSLTQLQPISVIFTVPEMNVTNINVAQGKEHLKVDALSQDGTQVLDKGELLVVDNTIDNTTGTVKLKAVFPNPDRKLWPGQFVNARLLLEMRNNATIVPSPAIQRGPDGTFVYVAQGDTAQVRSVKVAQIQAGQALIDEGIQPGEHVVTDGQYKLQPGSKISTQAQQKTGKGKGQAGGGNGAPAASADTGAPGSSAPAAAAKGSGR